MSDTAYVEKVWDFLEVGNDELRKLEHAIESGDTLSVRACTRELKLKAVTLGLEDVVRFAEEVEQGAYHCSLASTLESYQQLRVSFDGLKEELAEVAENH